MCCVSERFSLEKFMRVYDDDTGDYVEIREDRDSLELIELVQGERVITMPIAQARLVCRAVEEVSAHVEARAGEKKDDA